MRTLAAFIRTLVPALAFTAAACGAHAQGGRPPAADARTAPAAQRGGLQGGGATRQLSPQERAVLRRQIMQFSRRAAQGG